MRGTIRRKNEKFNYEFLCTVDDERIFAHSFVPPLFFFCYKTPHPPFAEMQFHVDAMQYSRFSNSTTTKKEEKIAFILRMKKV
jgi:hypothetical protein